jgi:hypothetical protein
MSFEYRTQTYYGSTPPELLTPPFPGFRLREIMPVTSSHNESHTTGDRCSSISNADGVMSSILIPYTMNVNRTMNVQWVIIWERYVPEKEEE